MSRPRKIRSYDLPTVAVYHGLRVVDAIRNRDRRAVADRLTHLTREQLYATVVALAAMIPDDKTPRELLAWNDEAFSDRLDNKQLPLEPHGTHAGYNRHRTRAEMPCPSCVEGERQFQRLRKRVKKVWRVESPSPRKNVHGCRPNEVMDRSEAAS